MEWTKLKCEPCGNDGWCGRDSHRPEEYVCKECNGCLDDNFDCESCAAPAPEQEIPAGYEKNDVVGEPTISYKVFTKYLKFAWGEELERLSEWMYAVEKDQDWGDGGDKYWIGLDVGEIGVPSLKDISRLIRFNNRDVAADLAVMELEQTHEYTLRQEYLMEELREQYYNL